MGFSSVDSFIIAFSTRDPRSGGIAARRCFILGHPVLPNYDSFFHSHHIFTHVIPCAKSVKGYSREGEVTFAWVAANSLYYLA